jgi:hypothetical protein
MAPTKHSRCLFCGWELGRPVPQPADEQSQGLGALSSELRRELAGDLSSATYDVGTIRDELARDLADVKRQVNELAEELNDGAEEADGGKRADPDDGSPLEQVTGRQDRPAPGMRASPLRAVHRPPVRPLRGPLGAFERVDAKSLVVRVAANRVVNYASVCVGQPTVDWLEVENVTRENADNVLARVWISGDYGEPWERLIPSIRAFDTYRCEDVNLPVDKKRMREVLETEPACLRFEILVDGRKVFSDSAEIAIHAFNEWHIDPERFPEGVESLAVFVTPNCAAVDAVLGAAKPRLAQRTGDASFDGYQSGSPERVIAVAEAMYLALGGELKITYSVPLASFEKTGQKIRRPGAVLRAERGTCLDLAVLFASCLEAAGLDAVIFLMRGHAYLGCWLSPGRSVRVRIDDPASYRDGATHGLLLPLNATAFARGESFETCRSEGQSLLDMDSFQCGIEVSACRMAGIKPLSWGDDDGR